MTHDGSLSAVATYDRADGWWVRGRPCDLSKLREITWLSKSPNISAPQVPTKQRPGSWTTGWAGRDVSPSRSGRDGLTPGLGDRTVKERPDTEVPRSPRTYESCSNDAPSNGNPNPLPPGSDGCSPEQQRPNGGRLRPRCCRASSSPASPKRGGALVAPRPALAPVGESGSTKVLRQGGTKLPVAPTRRVSAG